MSYKIFNEHRKTVNNKTAQGDAACVHKMKSVINENILRVALLGFNFIFLVSTLKWVDSISFLIKFLL